MKNKLRFSVLLLILAFMFLILPNNTYAMSQKLNNLNFYITVNEDASIDVTEVWNVYMSETGTLFKTFEIDSSKYSKIDDVLVKEAGSNEEFTKMYSYMYNVPEDSYYALKNPEGDFNA